MLSKIYKKTSTGVWERSDARDFNYSDGNDVEERLLQQLKSTSDLSTASDELQRLMIDWPSEYHLSPLRLNLLSSFNFTNCSTILEVGSGCGAITRQLGETCPDSEILSLDGSRRRAEITVARCRDLENVQVCCDSFADFESQNHFDLVTMIGVLEYSPAFFDSKNPVVAALEHARSMLSTNGVMVLAIENQLGLKYFNGCSEDHNGQMFWGINDQYLPDTVKTFGKIELQCLVKEAGFENVEFVYPFPDYKLPQLLLREGAFNNKAFNPGIMAGQYPSRDYICNGTKLFRESSVWNVLDRNDMLMNFSNSFLLFAFNGKGSIEDLTEPWLAKTYTSRRKKRYHIETTFLESDDKIVVQKQLSYDELVSESKDSLVRHHIDGSVYVEGTLYSSLLYEAISVDNPFEGFVNYLIPWFDYLCSRSKPFIATENEIGEVVSGDLLDCTPANLIWNQQKELCLIDQEWEYTKPLEVGFLLFRGIYRELLSNIEILEQSNMFAGETCFDVVKKVYSNFKLPFDNVIFQRYVVWESGFQMAVGCSVENQEELQHNIKKFFQEIREHKFNADYILKCDVDGISHELANARKQIEQLTQDLAQKNEYITHYSQSRSWRLTAPLRSCGQWIKRIVSSCVR